MSGRVVRWSSLERWDASISIHKGKMVVKQRSKEREFLSAPKEDDIHKQGKQQQPEQPDPTDL